MATKTKTRNDTREVATRPATASLAEQSLGAELNVYEQYGAATAQTGIVGSLLKFNKGDWLAGQEEDELATGTKLVAIMDQLLIGWIRWEDNKPSQQLMGLLIEGHQPPKRATLGDTDHSQWDVDENSGQPRDPWQLTNHLILKVPGAKVSDQSKLYTFATSSRGGIGAVGKLCTEFGKAMRERPNEWPVVALKSAAYDHPNKQFGRIKVPVFEVVGWEKKQAA